MLLNLLMLALIPESLNDNIVNTGDPNSGEAIGPADPELLARKQFIQAVQQNVDGAPEAPDYSSDGRGEHTRVGEWVLSDETQLSPIDVIYFGIVTFYDSEGWPHRLTRKIDFAYEGMSDSEIFLEEYPNLKIRSQPFKEKNHGGVAHGILAERVQRSLRAINLLQAAGRLTLSRTYSQFRPLPGPDPSLYDT